MKHPSDREGFERRAGAPQSEWVCDVACVAFAVFTLCCNAVVAFGGNLIHVALAVVPSAIGTALLWRRLPAGAREPRHAPRDATALSEPRAWGSPVSLVGALVAAAVWLRYVVARDAVELWWGAVAVLTLAAVGTRPWDPERARPPSPPARAGRTHEALLWTLAVACAVLALVVHRPDHDDSFYVNVAVAAADAPSRALLVHDSLRGIPDLPFSNPTQRAQSYEILIGALSALSGVSAISLFHWGACALAAAFVPLAWAMLLRRLVPGRWLLCVTALILLVIAAGDTHRGYGSIAFGRIWQGKAIFLNVVLPLVYANALRFADAPSARRFGLLFAAQSASLGLTSTAFWAAPLAAGLALCSAVRPTRAGLRTVILGVLASSHVVGVGLLLKGRVPDGMIKALEDPAVGAQLTEMLDSVLGPGGFHFLAVAGLLGAWTLLRPGIAQRFAIVVPLGGLLVVANPYIEVFIRSNITGPTQWRSSWALPLPLLLSLALTAPLGFARNSRQRGWAALTSLTLLSVAVFVLPHRTMITPQNVTFWMGTPRLKVEPHAYQWAGRITRSVPPGSNVLAPSGINVWLPTFHHPTYPLEVRPDFHWDLPFDDARVRFALTRYVGSEKRFDDSPDLLRQGLADYDLAAVLFAKRPWAPEIREILASAGYRPVHADPALELWLRGDLVSRRRPNRASERETERAPERAPEADPLPAGRSE